LINIDFSRHCESDEGGDARDIIIVVVVVIEMGIGKKNCAVHNE
jgi:hypothetical protein